MKLEVVATPPVGRHRRLANGSSSAGIAPVALTQPTPNSEEPEKTVTTIRLARMNLAVHGLQGDIRDANTYYDDPHRLQDGKPLWSHSDFVMANPPFNVDEVDAGKAGKDHRLPFGLPGVNKAKKVSNGNYLWISYFHSY